MPIHGKWHDGEQAQEYLADLVITDNQLCQVISNTHIFAEAPLNEIKISDRLGSVPRRLSFPGSGVFVTPDNQAIDNHLKKSNGSNNHKAFYWSTKIHGMESRFSIVMVCLLVLIGSIYGMSKYGIPYIAEKVSQHIPEKLIMEVNESTLEHLDNSFLYPTRLPVSRQQELRNFFATFEPEKRTVLFRRGNKVIDANAFALPGSTIIFTDQMVELAAHDEELLSIYFHETGHINYRHSIRSVLQSSAVVLFISFITGDGSGIAESLYTIPIVLAHSAYSRKFESEADEHAYQMMRMHNIPLHRFADIMSRLESKHTKTEGQSKIIDYFSSHPATADRIKKFENNQTKPASLAAYQLAAPRPATTIHHKKSKRNRKGLRSTE
jgi:Zn-dependent protease with chaperone function